MTVPGGLEITYKAETDKNFMVKVILALIGPGFLYDMMKRS
jgi:hypothetical protein